MKPVLLVIDVQKAFYSSSPESARSLTAAVKTINKVIAMFREKDLPVICIQHMNQSENLLPGQTKFETPDDMAVLPSDFHIHKTYSNSFNKTKLHEKIKEYGADTLFVTGYSAAHCVLSTYRGALDLDLKPILVRHAVASGEPEHIKFVEDLCEMITPGALAQLIA